MRRISNPPNPWLTTHAEWLGDPPAAELEIYEERARSIISENDSPDIGFRFSVNPYRGCFHACAYCMSGDTPILLGDGRTKPLADLLVGDDVLGTVKTGKYRRYVKTTVLNHWRRIDAACRVVMEDGTSLIASADHRFLTERGWKHVMPPSAAGLRRPHLTTNNHLLGTGQFAQQPQPNIDYKTGYLCGVVRGDALIGHYTYSGPRRVIETQHHFRLAMVDQEALQRTHDFLLEFGIGTHEFLFQAAVGERKALSAIRTHPQGWRRPHRRNHPMALGAR